MRHRCQLRHLAVSSKISKNRIGASRKPQVADFVQLSRDSILVMAFKPFRHVVDETN